MTKYNLDVAYLYQFPRFKYVPSMSPFCLKLETWLRMAEVNYEVCFFCSIFFDVIILFLLFILQSIVKKVV